jgi:hypothetical protein
MTCVQATSSPRRPNMDASAVTASAISIRFVSAIVSAGFVSAAIVSAPATRICLARLRVGHVRRPHNGISDYLAERIEPHANARQVTFSWPSLRLAQSAIHCPDLLMQATMIEMAGWARCITLDAVRVWPPQCASSMGLPAL